MVNPRRPGWRSMKIVLKTALLDSRKDSLSVRNGNNKLCIVELQSMRQEEQKLHIRKQCGMRTFNLQKKTQYASLKVETGG